MKDSWVVKQYNNDKVLNNSKLCNISKEFSAILYSRGYETQRDIDDFLNPQLHFMHSPFLLKNIDKAIQRIIQAIDKKEKIGIFSDSDLDGMTSLALISGLFNKLNVDMCYRYIKNDETYGITNKIIDEFKDNDVGLIITADSGIRDVDEIHYAKNNNIDVIITDHHEPDSKIPDAIVVNPKQIDCPYPFKDLAGVGVAFKLCHGLLLSFLPSYNKYFILISKNSEKYFVKIIRNTLSIEEFQENNLALLIEKFSDKYKDYVMLYNDTLDKSDIHIFGTQNIPGYKFSDFIFNTLHKNSNDYNNSTWNRTEHYNYVEEMETVLYEIQHYASPKILNFMQQSLVYVSIGSIADVMPMTNENRVMTKYGLEYFNKLKNPGISLFKDMGEANTKLISWSIAPLLNTPGRFGQTELTEKIFLSDDEAEIAKTFNEIKLLNEKRKELVKDAIDRVLDKINNDESYNYNNIDAAIIEDIPEGIAGLVAQRVSEVTGKPVIILTPIKGKSYFKGSGRCIGDIDFFSYVVPFTELFDRVGGHPQAFGFTIDKTKIPEVISKIDIALDNEINNSKLQYVDLEIDIANINDKFISEIMRLEPFGKNNEEPVFLSRNIVIESFSRFGVENNHGRYKFSNNPHISAIGWSKGNDMETLFKTADNIDIIYTAEKNVFRNSEYLQLILLDLDISNT